MKSLFLRSSVALACALSLAGCGGGSGNLLLSGSVINLAKDGLQLQNNNGTPLAVGKGSTSFAFPDLLRNDEDYNVTVSTQPTGAHCEVQGTTGKGRTGAFNVTSVIVSCVTDVHKLTATVSGLTTDGLVLVNGSNRVPVAAGATTVPFVPVADGSPYGVTVLTQPAGLTCTVTNGSGTMGSSDVMTVAVNCAVSTQ